MALVALGISLCVAWLSPTRTIFWFVIFGWSGIAATFCPSIILSLFWSKFTEKGAIASMVTGGLAVPFFQFFAIKIPILGPYFKELSTLPPSMAMAMGMGAIVSLIWPNPETERSFLLCVNSTKQTPVLDHHGQANSPKDPNTFVYSDKKEAAPKTR